MPRSGAGGNATGGLRVAVVGLLVAAAAAARPASAQAPDPEGAYRTPVSRIGICQCIGERNAVDLQCRPGPRECEASCGSTHYSFVPLTRQQVAKACHPQELYVVLPNADGRPGSGAITVFRGKAATLLDSAFAGAGLFAGMAASVGLQSSDVDQAFGPAIAARPPLPRRFDLFFPPDGTAILPQSEADLQAAVAAIKSRPGVQVEVVGDTDASAGEVARPNLSLDRARAVRDQLLRAGIDERAISTSGRGGRDPLVPARKGIAEPRNRRVEIVVR